MTVPKSYPNSFATTDLPVGYKPPTGAWAFWRTVKGLLVRDDKGKDIFLDSPDQTYVPESTSESPLSHKAAAAVIDKTIAEWQDQGYKAGRIVTRQNAFFKCEITHTTGIDPLTDKTGTWGKFPSDENVVRANRSPTASDNSWREGVIWEDLSFGSTTPLRFITHGNGVWVPLNQITVSRFRFYLYGTGSTYQSNLSNIKFFKADGTQMPNGWFVWGSRSGLGGQSAGTNYTGQSITAQYNASGWGELEPSATYDLQESISRVAGSLGYATFTKLEVYYSNGGMKTFTPGGGNLATCDPPLKSRFGDSTISAQSEILTAAKLANPTSTDPGRLTGESFTSAWNILSQAITNRVTALESKTVTLEAALSLLISRQPEVAPEHTAAQLNSRGEFVNLLSGGGILTYGNSRNGGTNTFNFPRNVYQSVVSYYANAAGDVIPMTTTTQEIAADATSIEISMILISAEAVTFVIEFHMRGNRVDVYEIPLI